MSHHCVNLIKTALNFQDHFILVRHCIHHVIYFCKQMLLAKGYTTPGFLHSFIQMHYRAADNLDRYQNLFSFHSFLDNSSTLYIQIVSFGGSSGEFHSARNMINIVQICRLLGSPTAFRKLILVLRLLFRCFQMQ